MAGDGPDGQLMNYLVRMVVPMRREFGRHVDVGQLPLDYAKYVERRLHGPRIADTPKAPPPAGGPTAEELRARVLKKYTSGLR
ncbi:hypothetical protein [Piscinibacter defluvii]|uniref:hypothetical protein n=1 Tax=Piscinibacter defluvii TaxID=1796922 RepID=UPI000FDE4702|nr:hypothetical protein [Piscinibacter defluvii]